MLLCAACLPSDEAEEGSGSESDGGSSVGSDGGDAAESTSGAMDTSGGGAVDSSGGGGGTTGGEVSTTVDTFDDESGDGGGSTGGDDTPVQWGPYGDPEPVELVGYDDHAMEPFIARDGAFIFFNNLNSPEVNTELHYAARLDDTTFEYLGILEGTSTPGLEGVPSLTLDGQIFFNQTTGLGDTGTVLRRGLFADGVVTDIEPVMPNAGLGDLLLGPDVSPDGEWLYFVISNGSGPDRQMDLAVTRRTERGDYVPNPDLAPIVDALNTDALEYAPAISADGRELYFNRLTLTPQGAPMTISIMHALRNPETGTFEEAAAIEAITGFVEGATPTTDGTALYYHQDADGLFELRRVTREPLR